MATPLIQPPRPCNNTASGFDLLCPRLQCQRDRTCYACVVDIVMPVSSPIWDHGDQEVA